MTKFINFLITSAAVMLGTILGLALFFLTVIIIEQI